MPQVIEWRGAAEDDIVWRYPVEEIQWGAQLVVHEYEVAVFLRDGKAYDVFPAGRHTLTTQNLPLLSRVFSLAFGKTPFKSTVIYVAQKQFAGKWGAKGQTTELAPLMVHGQFWFRINDPNLFVNQVVGAQGAYTSEQVDEFLRGIINERVIDQVSQYDLATAFTKLNTTSTTIKVNINDALNRIGTDLIDFKFEGIDTSDEFRDRLFWLRQRMSGADVLRMETMKDVGKSLATSPGAGFGSGMVLFPQIANTPMQYAPQQQAAPSAQPQVAFVSCPKCQAQVAQGAKFCPNCGNVMTVPQATGTQTTPCPNCGKPVSIGAKFCGECGQKIG